MAATKKLPVADIVRYGTQIVLPNDPKAMTYREGAAVLTQAAEQDEMVIDFQRKFEGYEPHDAAAAFTRVIERRFGIVLTKPTVVQTFFGPMSIPPQIISFPIGFDESATIVLGTFPLPAIKGGQVTTSIEQDRGENKPRYFMIAAKLQQQYRDWMDTLANEVELEVRNNSIFKGKQFGYRLKDDDGDYLPIPNITFLDLSRTIQPIFPLDVEEQLEVSVHTPIAKTERWQRAGLPLKRGVLLYGPYGTGKTLEAFTVAKLCRDNGWTFILCDRPDEFAEILRLARNYQPCVVFCEDIDRVTSGRRTVEIDAILNILDGIESKNAEIMVVVTTNDYESINKAMLRAGRLDARINIPLPDSNAVQRLLRSYGAEMIGTEEDLSEAGNLLSDFVTASDVAEVITLAKGAGISNDDDLDDDGNPRPMQLSAKSITYAAKVVRRQAELAKEPIVENLSPAEKAAHVLAEPLRRHLENMQRDVPVA